MEFSIEIFNFHGIPWKSMEFHGKFHELTERFLPGSVRASVCARVCQNNAQARFEKKK
jgi:hypothetical protein